MTAAPLLDTHAWVWWVERDRFTKDRRILQSRLVARWKPARG